MPEAPPSSQNQSLDPEPTHVGAKIDGRSSTPGDAPKRRFGKYRIIARLGEGGMAQVHLALMRGPVGFNKLLVVKSMREGLSDPIYLRSFIHEAKLAAQLNHPNVVQTYEVGEHGGQLFIAMEYVEGQSLRAVQRRLAPARLPLAVQLRILVDVARGLQHAHQLKAFDGRALDIVHRDVSPQNIMLTYEGQVKLLDFGIAKANGSDELTRDGMIKGKVDYMAPEQLTGAPIDARADVFPLGVLLWEAITGARFSGGAEVAEVTKIHNRVMGTELRVGDVAPDAPTRLVEICNRAVSVDRHNRQASAEDFANELADYLAETSRGTDSRKLADILAPVFEKDRAKIRNIIDEQVRLAESADDNEDEMSAVPLVTTADSQAATPHEMEQIAELKATLIEQQRARELDAKSSSRVAVIASLCVAALVGVVGAMAMKSAPPASATSATRDAPERATEPRPEPPARTMIAVNISVTPENATVTLDGSRIVTPFSARIESDGRIHHVTATAEGFAREERAVVFDQDRLVTLALEPAANDSPVAETTGTRRPPSRNGTSNVAAAETRPVAAPQAVPRDPPPATPPTHMAPSIDSDDPYQ